MHFESDLPPSHLLLTIALYYTEPRRTASAFRPIIPARSPFSIRHRRRNEDPHYQQLNTATRASQSLFIYATGLISAARSSPSNNDRIFADFRPCRNPYTSYRYCYTSPAFSLQWRMRGQHHTGYTRAATDTAAAAGASTSFTVHYGSTAGL